LRKDGLEDDTIIIFFADNARLEPRGIHWCTDSGLRVPLIIKWPKHFPPPADCAPGTVKDQLVSLIDVTATTLDLAGIPKPANMQGRILLGEHAESPRTYVVAARDRIDETVLRIRSVHDKRYHYIRTMSAGPTFSSLNRYKEKCFLIMPLMRELYAKGELHGAPLELMKQTGPCEELYDLQTDPYEIDNLVALTDLEHRGELELLRLALRLWTLETNDLGGFPEPASVVEPFEKEMDQWFGTPAWYLSTKPKPTKPK
jgi:arylsulfatase A-like enzyme